MQVISLLHESVTVNVLVIAEDWCGDVHRHVPALEIIPSHARKVKTRYIMREDHPEVFARFLTNGGEAIPKFVFFKLRSSLEGVAFPDRDGRLRKALSKVEKSCCSYHEACGTMLS